MSKVRFCVKGVGGGDTHEGCEAERQRIGRAHLIQHGSGKAGERKTQREPGEWPQIASFMPLRMMPVITSRGFAPSAIRIPNSWVAVRQSTR